MAEQVFVNARVVLPNEVLPVGSVRVVDGRIDSVDTGQSSLAGAFDLEGDLLLAGLVEVHTDNLERHVMPRPQVRFPLRGAILAHDAELAAAGITTVLDAIGVGDPYGDGFRSLDQRALLETLDELTTAQVLRVRHFLHVRCELPAPNAIELFVPFADDKRLQLISLMDHTPGQRQWTQIDHARTYYTGKKGWSDARFDEEVRLAPERQAQFAEPHRAWFADFARQRGIALATHDDTTIAHVDEARALGASMSEFPTTMEAAKHAHRHGLDTIAGAPNVVRGGSHSGNVAAIDLAREGVLDGLSSDYVPSSLLQAAWLLHQKAQMPLYAAVHCVTAGPAHAAGLTDVGSIAPGLRADLIHVRELGNYPVVFGVYQAGVRVA